MKQILLFGAGKSATALIDYLLVNAASENWQVTVADADQQAAESKIGSSPFGKAVSLDIHDEVERAKLISAADIVISLMPPALHVLVAKDCIQFGKSLLTASYVDENIKALQQQVEEKGLLFLCEMGLDPGIDHMSAKKMIDEIREEDAFILSFHSHCGGLVAPESDNSPWHYKISWNPANVVNAGKAGAIFRKDGEIREMEYKELFADKRFVFVPGYEVLCWYPNRDSISYINRYGLDDCDTFIRTTLRHPDFMYGWKNIVDVNLTSDEQVYETDGKTLAQLFKEHLDRNGFSEWLEEKLREQFDSTKNLLAELVNLVELEKEAEKKGVEPVDEFMLVDDKGDLKQVDIDDLKVNAAASLADRMHDASLTLKQLFYLGLDDNETEVNRGACSAAKLLQFALEKKLGLQPGDKDLVVMQHEIEFIKDEKKFRRTSTLLLTGDDDVHTAMAKTVGMPLGIAAKLILNGTISLTGLQIPTSRQIYDPVLSELARHGISFNERTEEIK